MRITDNRYVGEKAQFDLAIRLLQHRARTHIITRCTGFSQDRIRKLYARYFKYIPGMDLGRHRGKSPSSVEFFLRNPWVQAEATVLAHVFAAWGLLRILPDLETAAGMQSDSVRFGQSLCEAYEAFVGHYPATPITFEHAWNLLHALVERAELLLQDCADCGGLYVQDALALDGRRCPTCRVPSRPQPPGGVTSARTGAARPAARAGSVE